MSGGGRPPRRAPGVTAPSALVQLLERCPQMGPSRARTPHPTHTHPDVLTLVAHAVRTCAEAGEERGGPGTKGNGRSRPKAALSLVGALIESSRPSPSALRKSLKFPANLMTPATASCSPRAHAGRAGAEASVLAKQGK